MAFELFDPAGELAIREGSSLPHWFQPGVTYFVTFRTVDSVPATLLATWHRRRADWLHRHGIDPAQPKWKLLLRDLPPAAQRQFESTFTAEFMNYLDRGYGACVLRQPGLAQHVADALRHFDGERYQLGDFVVMPNHVHVLVCLLRETEIESQCYSWKRYSAGKINGTLKQRGRFWQEESFDHLVRNPEQFEYFRRYIADNPLRAKLRQGEYLHYRFVHA